ncbi:reverse transcriptase domain-containing protein [Tanacetum coccineum]
MFSFNETTINIYPDVVSFKLDMDTNTSLGRLCLNMDEVLDMDDLVESERDWNSREFDHITDSGKRTELKAYTFYKMETEEIYFVVNLEEVDVEPSMILGRPFIKLAKCIIDFNNGTLTIWPDTLSVDSGDDLDELLASINVDDLPPLDTVITTIFPKEEMEVDVYERVLLLNERRPIIETLKYSGKHKMLLDSVLMVKLKLDGMGGGEQEVREYKVLKNKEDPKCFILPVHMDRKLSFNALVHMESNVNIMPYKVYELLEHGKVKPKIDKVYILDFSNAETMGRLLTVLVQIGTIT